VLITYPFFREPILATIDKRQHANVTPYGRSRVPSGGLDTAIRSKSRIATADTQH